MERSYCQKEELYHELDHAWAVYLQHMMLEKCGISLLIYLQHRCIYIFEEKPMNSFHKVFFNMFIIKISGEIFEKWFFNIKVYICSNISIFD